MLINVYRLIYFVDFDSKLRYFIAIFASIFAYLLQQFAKKEKKLKQEVLCLQGGTKSGSLLPYMSISYFGFSKIFKRV